MSSSAKFYLHRTKDYGWSKNVLIHQIENQTYQKTLLSSNASLPSVRRFQILEQMIDTSFPYVGGRLCMLVRAGAFHRASF